MIPVKLLMRNFMCYRDNVPPLLFDGFHTACISGDNGNGKSALIDAMTWALWGRARAASDDDLIYQGQQEMEVEFDFLVGQQPYRIIRKRSRPKRRGSAGQSILEFQIAANGSFKPISGDSISRTQQKIIDILHMDYTTFINSAFLRQGHADEFTIKRPVERKQVLADILGLAIYDELESEAKESAGKRETEKIYLESAIKDMDTELAQKPAYQADFERVQNELSNIEKVVRERETSLNGLRQKKEALKNRQLQLSQVKEHIAEMESSLEHWDRQIKQHCSKVKEYEELIGRRTAIEEGYNQFSLAKKLYEELDRKARRWANLNQQKHQLEMAIMHAQQELLREHAITERRITELENIAQILPQFKDEFSQVNAQLHQISEQEGALRRKRENLQESQAKLGYIESAKAQLMQNIAGIDEKLKLLLSQSEAICPLCETELGVEGIKLIETKYASDRQRLLESLNSNRAELDRKSAEVRLLVEEISRIEIGINRDKDTLQSKAGVLTKSISEAEEAGSRLDEEKERLVEIEQRLAVKDFVAAEQESLSELEAELVGLDYDSQRHDEARQRLTDLQQHEEPRRKLEEAEKLINQEKESATKAEEFTRKLRNGLEFENQKRQELITELNLLPQLDDDLKRAEAEYQTLIAQQRQMQEQVGSAKARIHRLTEIETKKQEREAHLAEATREENIYKELAEAFGKKGIQTLIIETALPEIEAEANRLLGRMTDNRMHVKIETQRETKKGDVVETLDINISDELGTRNYEMFSGGEAFRINFAIRIALSKLLARRAGAPLPTLIIDEGFGTQDVSGIEKIKEAINSIQNDFDKILVITHMEELKEAFPARIEVIKTTHGSTLEIIT